MARKAGLILFLMILVALAGEGRISAQAFPPQGSASQPTAAGPKDLSQLESDAIGWLQDLIRINTTNPPGNELAAAKYIAGILGREGIQAEIFESTPGRGFLVARLSSSAMPDPSKALLLMGHLDVVGADKAKWTEDPFGGVIKGNELYGRGAIDDKGITVANLAALIALKRSGARLNRDVILLAEGDAEGGHTGIKFAVDKHWDKIAAGYAINEGGRVIVANGKPLYVGVQVSEKVSVNVDVIAKGTAASGAIPRPDNSIARLSAAMAKIVTYQPPVQFNSVTRAYFEGLSPIEDEDTGKWMRALETSDRGDHAARWISDAKPAWNAMLHDTIAPTILQAGTLPGAIPGEARATLNVHLLPGNMVEPLVGKLQQLANDPQVRFEVQPGAGETAPSSLVNSDLYDSISRVAKQEFAGVTVVPEMSPGATDSTPLRLRSVQAYGLVPFPLTEEQLLRARGDEERIPLDSFRKGIDFVCGIVTDFVVAK